MNFTVFSMLSAAALMPAAGYGQVNEIAAAFTSPFEDRVSLAPSSWGTPRPVFHSGATLAANNNCTFSATQSANLGSSGTHSDASDTFGVIEPPIGSGSAASITITFGVPIVAFGGLWGAVTTGGSPGAAQITVQFFDAANTQVGPTQIISYLRSNQDGAIDWHGWAFASPVTSVTISTAKLLVFDSLVAKPDLHFLGVTQSDGLHINFNSVPSQSPYSYVLEQTPSLRAPVQWQSSAPIFGSGSPKSFIDAVATNHVGTQFYRLRMDY